MNAIELSWNNAEGLRLHAMHWPVESPRAVITLLHGQGEHIGRYAHLARWFSERGVALIGYDHQGYGKSEGRRGHARQLNALLDDIGLSLDQTRSLYPGTPLFLYGHSMGGNLALNYTLRRRPALAGLIATGPWVRLAFPAPLLKIFAGRLLYRITPTLRLPNGLAVHFLSHEPEVVAAYQNDPLVHDRLSVAAGIDLLDGAIWLDHFQGEAPVPVLLQHGGDDKITSPEGTRALAGRLKGDITFREWPGLYHEIHNEPEQGSVFAFTLEWIKGRLKDA